MKLAKALLTYRKKNNLTQMEMAQVLQITRVRYNEIENGDTKISQRTIAKISNLLGLKLTTIYRYLCENI